MSALLFVPATDDRKIHKAESLGPHRMILDLEDAVAEPEKERARANAVQWLHRRRPGTSPGRWVRINALDSSHWERDLEAVLPALPDGLVVPKVEHPGQLRALEDHFKEKADTTGHDFGRIPVVILLETAAGVMRMAEVLSASPWIRAAALGIADLAADTGVSFDFAFQHNGFRAERVRLVLASKALRLEPPWDAVYPFLGDEGGFHKDAKFGRDIGCQGKMIIHPSQLAAVREAYRVSEKEVSQARRVLQAFHLARQSGRGAAVTEDGLLVDAPTVRWAEDTLRRAEEQ